MRIAVLNITVSGISGGYKSYLQNILPRLSADDRVEALLCVSPASLEVRDWLPVGGKIELRDCPQFRPFGRGLSRELGRHLTAFSPDVIFVPIARPVSFGHIPVVTMIQNMAPMVSWRGAGLLEKARLAARWVETFRAVKRADGVIAISDFVRDFLLKRWGVPPGKVASIYFGAALPDTAQSRPAQVPSGWGDFVFTAGSIDPYRSLEDIIGCAAQFRRDRGTPLNVVVAGAARSSMRSYERRLKIMAERAGVSADLCWTGQLSRAEMTWCYKNCRVFVMTSRVETSPVTALEALACGAVCIAADNAPLPEFFGDAAYYYTPGDAQMLATRVAGIYALGPAAKNAVSANAHERAQKFNWDTTATETLDFLEVFALRFSRAYSQRG